MFVIFKFYCIIFHYGELIQETNFLLFLKVLISFRYFRVTFYRHSNQQYIILQWLWFYFYISCSFIIFLCIYEISIINHFTIFMFLIFQFSQNLTWNTSTTWEFLYPKYLGGVIFSRPFAHLIKFDLIKELNISIGVVSL